jgi:hypothetical protein
LQLQAGVRSFRVVKRLSKVILITLGIVAVLLAAAIVGAIVYLQSNDGRAQIEESLSKAIRTPIRITKIDFLPWRELRAEGVSVPGAEETGAPLAAAPSFRADYRFWPLLRGELQLHSLVLDQPHLIWGQNAEGKWVWPTIEKEKEGATPREVANEPKKEKRAKKKSSVTVSGLKLADGTLELFDLKRRLVFRATGTNADFGDFSDGVTGTATFAKLVWNDVWVFENVTARFRYANGLFTLKDLAGSSLGGQVSGQIEISTGEEGSPFKTDLEVRSVNLSELAQAAGWSAGDVGGRVSGTLTVAGKSTQFARLEGPGHLKIEDGYLRKLELFESLAHVLAFPELANLQPRETTVDFKFRDEKAFIDSLVLRTGTLTLNANGVARFDEKLILDSQLVLPETTYKTLPDFAASNFTKRDNGLYILDFKITGKTNAPKTDLAEKLIGGSVKDKVEDLLSGLFGTKTKEKEEEEKKKKDIKEKKKKKDEAKATDSTGPSPNLRQP